MSLTRYPTTAPRHLQDEIKQVFTAPPDVLYPGEGARILEPIVGPNSILLLDEGAHMALVFCRCGRI